jgi:hypothetical protein
MREREDDLFYLRQQSLLHTLPGIYQPIRRSVMRINKGFILQFVKDSLSELFAECLVAKFTLIPQALFKKGGITH